MFNLLLTADATTKMVKHNLMVMNGNVDAEFVEDATQGGKD